tara:strand:+ start:42 stop:1331 length:1290 start_codon:yes stop_codon:yes gene_type:complete
MTKSTESQQKSFRQIREDMHMRVNPYMLWKNEEPVKYSMHLSKTFGPPDELTQYRAVWYAKDGFKRIVVKDEYILHGSPAPHYDFIYCYIDLKVPHDLAKPMVDSSESIIIDYLKNEVGARCGSITANAVTLNYVLDCVAGRARPSKKEYEKRILQMRSMFKSGKTYTTDWWPDETKDADPKNPYYNKDDIENVDEAARIPRKAGQPAKSDKHSDLYTDEDPKGTIHGLKFTTAEDAKRSVRKIKGSGRAHAHKIQAAIAMEQRAKVAGKTQAAAVYRSFIEQMKKKTKKMNEDLEEQNRLKAAMMRAKARISPAYSMAKKELKDRVKKDPSKPKISHAASVAKKYDGVDARTLHNVTEAPVIGGIKMKKLGKSKPGGYKSLVSRHLGASAAEKIDKSDGAKLVAKGKKTGNTELVRKGNFIKNVISKK